MKEQINRGGFNLKALVFVVLGLVLLIGPVAGTVPYLSAKERIAKCLGNLRQVGLGLVMWENCSEDGEYPPAALPWFAGENEIGPWPDMLTMEGPFSPQNIQKNEDKLKEKGVDPYGFVKTIDNTEVFMCPADDPHPHPMNEARAKAEKLWRAKDKDGYKYSYGLSAAATKKQFAKDASSQVLSADGVWYEIYNFSAAYVDDPKAKYDEGGNECNRMGYFHAKEPRANVVCRDGSARTVKYGEKGKEIDTNEVFLFKKGEALTEKY